MKTEGTTQTYGQLVILGTPASTADPSSLEGGFSSTASSPAVAQDTIVQVVESSDAPAGSSSVSTSIALAAVSSTGTPMAVVPAGTLSSVNNSVDMLSSNVTSTAFIASAIATIVGSSVKPKEEIDKALVEARKFDLFIAYHSKKSEPLQFNALKRPHLNASFVYNYFMEDEENIAVQEDHSKDPLLTSRAGDVPKYVELRWNIADTTEPLAGTVDVTKKNQQLRKQTFAEKRGQIEATSNSLPFSGAKRKKKFNPIVQDGINKKVVDIHEPEIAFASIANSNVFANGVSTIINVEKEPNSLSDVPFDSLIKV